MNQDLCIRSGQEGPNFCYIAQVVEGNVGNWQTIHAGVSCCIGFGLEFRPVENS